MLAEGAPLLRGRVAGAHADADVRRAGRPCRSAAEGDARHGRPQVPVDVMDERLERRHVQHPQPVQRVARARVAHEPVEAPQERGERLAAAGRARR